MTFAAVAIGVGAVAAGYLASQGAQGAAQTQANAMNQATQAQEQMYNQQLGLNAPYRSAGQKDLQAIQGGLGTGPAVGGVPSGYFTHQFNASDLNANLAPNWKFQLQQGLGAMKNAENLSGGLLSGNALRSLNNYAQNFSGNAYQQAYDNYTNNQANIYNRLAGIANMGMQSGMANATGSPQYAQGISSTIQGAGTALGAGQAASANAMSGAAQGVGNAAFLGTVMNTGSPATSATTYAPGMSQSWYGNQGYTLPNANTLAAIGG